MVALQDIDLTSPSSYYAAFSTGVLLHLLLFRRGEWDLWATHLLATTGTLWGATTLLLPFIGTHGDLSIAQANRIVAPIIWTCISGIFTSLLVYRAAFHRLNRFPGPFAARLSNFYITSLSIKKFHLFEEVQKLHAKHGDIVRIGPSELSIANTAAYNLIHSNSSACQKGPWYNIMHPIQSLQMTRDRKIHAQRRKTWDKGLGSKALRDYEPRVEQYTDQLLDLLKEQEGSPVDVSTVFNFYSFDVMGDLAFGSSFNMLKERIVHYYMKTVHANMAAVGVFSHLVWIFPIVKAIPGLNYEHLKLQSWLDNHVSARREKKLDKPDLFSWLLADYEAIEKKTPQNLVDLVGDAHLIVVAGSDTTAASLTFLFYELSQNPAALQKVREEIDQYFSENERPTASTLSKLEYLSACINETLRLHPPVPSGVQRITPPEGLQLGETFIPGDTIVQVPTYTLQRDERWFVRPNEFIPERWTSQPELVKDATAFTPFGTGRYSCAGKQLGLMEIRFVTSQIVHRYDVRLAPGQKPEKFLDGCKDTFTAATAKLDLVFDARK